MRTILGTAAAILFLTGAAASPAQAQSMPIVGEVRWGSTFQKNFGNGLMLDIMLLGKPDDSQNGIYVSVLNKRLPKQHQFVLLPELISGHESNFIGIFVIEGDDLKDLAKELRSTLEGYRLGGQKLTYFTETFNEAQLVKIEEANLTIGHHGESEEKYEAADKVLDAIAKKTGVFQLLEYTLSTGGAQHGAPHINSIKFSFQPEGQ